MSSMLKNIKRMRLRICSQGTNNNEIQELREIAIFHLLFYFTYAHFWGWKSNSGKTNSEADE